MLISSINRLPEICFFNPLKSVECALCVQIGRQYDCQRTRTDTQIMPTEGKKEGGVRWKKGKVAPNADKALQTHMQNCEFLNFQSF